MTAESRDAWDGYRRTVVEIRRPIGGDLRVRPAPPGEVGVWPWQTREPVYLLTAWDPGDERPGDAVNRRHQAALEEDLRAVTRELFVAVGTDPVTGRREEGVAVRGASEGDVLALAARYRQDAVFAWTPTEWATVSCRERRRVSMGWAVDG